VLEELSRPAQAFARGEVAPALHRELPQDHVGLGAPTAAQPSVDDRLLEEPVGCLRAAEMAFSLRRLSVSLGEGGGVAETL
jgi:hypothetical protein